MFFGGFGYLAYSSGEIALSKGMFGISAFFLLSLGYSVLRARKWQKKRGDDQMEIEFPPKLLAACGRHGIGVYLISNDISAAEVLAAGTTDQALRLPWLSVLGCITHCISIQLVGISVGQMSVLVRGDRGNCAPKMCVQPTRARGGGVDPDGCAFGRGG